MNLIKSTVFKQNLDLLSNWVDSTPVSDMIDSVTYDVYESSNPFRKKFSKEEISNKGLRVAANTTTAIGAEVFSVFANPYYIPHKVMQIPVWYNNVVDAYKKSSLSSNK
ncbi:MAG: hypothetical protein NC191_02360 [Muribaculaceae bacterium]|nr:hypothetical protein [Muribaculaceae bacterium]